MKIRVFTQFNSPFHGVADRTIPVMRQYCERHGYDLHVTFSEDWQRSIVWDRFRIMAENADGCDWMVHLDADVLLTNHLIRIEELLPRSERMCMALCSCEDGKLRLNDGVAFYASDAYMKWYLMQCFETEAGNGIWCGQDVIQRDLDNNKLDGILKIERQKAMNSFRYSEYNMPDTTLGNWTRGDFALHLPGCSNERREMILDFHSELIIR